MAQTENLLHRPLDMERDGIDIVIHQHIGDTADDVVTIRISLDQAVQVGKFLLGAAAAKPKPSGAVSADFEEFWRAYPRKENKAATFAIWGQKKCSGDMVQLMLHLSTCVDSEQWQEDGGKYVPMASTYLRQKRYLDPVDTFSQSQYK